MQNDKLLYRLLFSCVVVLLVVAVALPAVMQGDTGAADPIPNDAFELTGILDSISNQEIIVDGIPVDIRVADLNTRLTLGDTVRVEGTLSEGIFTAREVGPAALPSPAATPEVGASNESSGIRDDDDDNFEFRGIVESVDDTFVIVSGRRVEILNTEIEAPLVVGQLVKVEGRLQSGIFTAREIELPDDDGFFRDDDDDDFDDIFDDDDDLTIPADCTVNAPAGWVSYTIRSGESLSSIAARSGSRVSELVRVNCLSNPRIIVAGSSLFLPRVPTSFPGTGGGNESSGSRSQNFPDNSGGNESSGSRSRNSPDNSSGGNESSGSNSRNNESSGSSS